ncbi:MAG: cupredoxin domain-containing protein [Nitrososphaera sp.]|nr:cupredoxin domain-containing protein [Nitrososphaera sp.]
MQYKYLVPALLGLSILGMAALLSNEALAGGGGGRSYISEECNDPVCDVTMRGATFAPDTLNVRPDSTIVWTNTDKMPHSVTSGIPKDESAGLLFDSGFLMPGAAEIWEYRFDSTSAGTFDYFCRVHPTMVGKVIVAGEIAPEFPHFALAFIAASAFASLIAVVRSRKNNGEALR